MNDIHIRAILLIVIAVLCIGGAVGLAFAETALGAAAILLLIGLVAVGGAIFALLFCESSEAPGDTP